jgi:hypothetical protein
MWKLMPARLRGKQSSIRCDCIALSGSSPERCRWKDTCLTLNSGMILDGCDGSSGQLLSGWHQDDAGRSLWSAREALMVLRNPGPGSVLFLSGLLPPSAHRAGNTLRVECEGRPVGLIRNYSHGCLEFGLRVLVPSSPGELLHLRFSVEDLYHPSETTSSPDRRGLGFALFRISVAPVGLLTAFRTRIADVLRRRRSALLQWLLATIPEWIDASCRRLAERGIPYRKPAPDFNAPPLPGLSVAVLDTGEGAALDACLSSIRTAAEDISEPLEVIVVSARRPDPVLQTRVRVFAGGGSRSDRRRCPPRPSARPRIRRVTTGSMRLEADISWRGRPSGRC